ncbi:cysteine synthase A [Anoxybacillus sp. B7M1]|jgi:cysteine synthase|uniref:Cysteine synthase n=1 Tax=Anoxybacteroides rupiense TaxID=311460 RepID=A0ABD5IYM5_9BACL|nr:MULTISPECIES: cysteine synthase A [Anoxybacillus]ANB57801.1 cysteine synthase A [Anoxybacillus sp. B2M1]ANB62476.1 cysteine synthase A [Anoxybacillus sp. B7M1]KXG09836.1 Cysteine synthase [Anoxybacillus sp. P3H1B]MBB3908381.1 cysteine synthase A [Anoxybacillus rupiensis]MBS2773052.1 cysteine synthase A [Anoxybacillus rupiensis]
MKRYQSILDVIGNTPVVKLNRIPDPKGAEVYIKLESFNPGGSVKDRAAFQMIQRAEEEGKIVPGKSTIIEPTSGNTGIGLAMVCAAKGYRCMITMPDNATMERVKLLKAYGAEVHLTPSSLRMQGAIDEAHRLAAVIEDSFIPMQFENPANPDAHRQSTALEILAAFEGRLDAFVLTAGTGGTVTGTGEELKKHLPRLRIYVVEPYGSPVLSGGEPGPHKIPGTGPGFVPKILNRDIFDEILLIKDEDAQTMARRLAAEEGILVGASAGAAAHYAIEIAKRLPSDARVLCMAPDSGERYLSWDLFNF